MAKEKAKGQKFNPIQNRIGNQQLGPNAAPSNPTKNLDGFAK